MGRSWIELLQELTLHPGALVALLCLVFPGCDGPNATLSNIETWDSAGTQMVSYTTLMSTESLELGTQPEVWIRGDERIAPFDRISALAILEDGSVIVADGGANQVHAFSADGTYRWSAGRAGDGPGEFRMINFMFVTPGDTVLVVDGRLGRLTVLSGAGEILRDEALAREAGTPAALLPNGELLYMNEQQASERVGGVQHTQATFSAVDVTGTSARFLVTTPGSDSFYGHGGGRNLVVRFEFMRRPFVAAVNDGFVVALSDRPQIDRYGADGDLLARIRVPTDALSVGIDDAQAVRDAFVDRVPEPMRGAIRELISDVPIPDRWPPIGGLIVDDEDRLWVQSYRPESPSKTSWYVFTGSGEYVDHVVAPRGFTPRVIRGGTIAGVWSDELEVQSVRLYSINGA